MNILNPQHPVHRAIHVALSHLDYLAAGMTCTSTILLARHRRIGFLILAAGALVWIGVACLSRFSGRNLTGMMASSAVTIAFSIYGYIAWQK